ncbi:hypothetical protein [Puia dinghuensis]|uniref:MoxR-vWA-beta-propeller ternary system domain-containing protein n=1 Tax=Puia dinghuensis TaxID=1792502 RepID=A0A8J2U9U7_9BACT|nr:hypothetical protein [Puia dinghuensis]GGA89037.1 hypothetical protein GCM10011511_10370 [Puia dinghuensis]
MQLNIRPHHKNDYPLTAIVVKGETLSSWIGELQSLGLSLAETTCYPLPGTRANSLWGCLLVPKEGRLPADIGRNSYCQRVHPLLYIPENSRLAPTLTPQQLDKMVKGTPHFFHPSIGWVELREPVDWVGVINPPRLAERMVTRPADTVVVPGAVRSFHILGLPPEEVLEKLDTQLFPEKRPGDKGPLSILERLVLLLLRLIFSWGFIPLPFLPFKKKSSGSKTSGSKASGKRSWWSRLVSPVVSRLEEKFMDLEERNKTEVDKLLKLFKKDPEEALKYAIPLDSGGTHRGKGGAASFSLTRRWLDLSLFGRSLQDKAGGGSIQLGNEFQRLNQQYQETAKQLIKNNEYQKAAFIYLRLLKSYTQAAQTLEEGKLYAEAASVYLKYNRDRVKAAECYEKGGMIQPAIDLYKELGKDEKVGDLYRSINRREEANHYFEKVAGEYTVNGQYVKASLVLRNKMEDGDRAQRLLMEGWRSGKDAVKCLNNYFSHLGDGELLQAEVRRVYEEETDGSNRPYYLDVMKCIYRPQDESTEVARDIAYEIVAQMVEKEPSVVAELQAFNKEDRNIVRDILKYKHSRR